MLSSTNSSSSGVALTQVSGTFTAPAGSIQNASNPAFLINGSSDPAANVNVSYGGTITDDVGMLVQIQNVTAASMHTFSGLITDNFDGDGTEQGISLTGNTGANISFSGGINIRTTTNAAFTSTGAGNTGTLTITDPAGATANKLQTTTGTALNIGNTNIGAGGLTFESINAGTLASGPTNGVIINTTGASGFFSVTGTGSDDSGGTIQRATGDAISLNSTRQISLTQMNFSTSGQSHIDATSVNGLTLKSLTFRPIMASSAAA